MRPVYRSDQFIQLQLHSCTVPVLSVLNKEHHEESDDSCAGVYDQLPGVTEPKYWAHNSPTANDKHGRSKGSGVSCSTRSPFSKAGEQGIRVHGFTPLKPSCRILLVILRCCPILSFRSWRSGTLPSINASSFDLYQKRSFTTGIRRIPILRRNLLVCASRRTL